MSDSIASLSPPPGLARHWCGGDAFETRFLEAMSLLAPEVERFLIATVRAGLACPGTAPMAAAGLAFVREEAGHSAAHHVFNRQLAAQGVDLDATLAGVRRLSQRMQRWLSPRMGLAVSAAFEHLSAVVSLAYLRSAGRTRIQAPEFDRLFAEHARDEIGHRAVVFDLLQAAGGGGWLTRALVLPAVSLVALLQAARLVAALLAHDRAQAPQPRSRWRWRSAGASLLGMARWSSLPALLQHWWMYLLPGFHPRALPDR